MRQTAIYRRCENANKELYFHISNKKEEKRIFRQTELEKMSDNLINLNTTQYTVDIYFKNLKNLKLCERILQIFLTVSKCFVYAWRQNHHNGKKVLL